MSRYRYLGHEWTWICLGLAFVGGGVAPAPGIDDPAEPAARTAGPVQDEARYRPIPSHVPGLDPPSVSLDGAWRFTPRSDGDRPDAEGAGWFDVRVPGQWVPQGFDVPEGQWAAFARSFEVPPSWRGHRAIVRFEAVFSTCEVMVNGRRVGGHEGGFTAFEVDVTDAVRIGRNDLLVRVRGRTDVDKLASASQYAVHDLGGITRPVLLFAVPEVHVAALRVRTELAPGGRDAALRLDVELAGGDRSAARRSVEVSLSDPGSSSRVVVRRRFDLEAPGRSTLELPVPDPRLWDPEHPELYDLNLHLREGETITQTITERIGLRAVEVRGGQLLVNGRPIALRGVNRHVIHPFAGRVVDADLARRDATLLRDANVNYVRTSHYPPTRAFLDACDELGIVVECEAPICWMQHGANPNWGREDWSHTDRARWLGPMLRQNLESVAFNFNHPSVVIWSLANESAWSDLWAETFAAVAAADPSRPASFHDQCWGGYNNHGSTAPIANMHYPGPGFAAEAAAQRRPVLFGEYAHLSAYNRRELVTDPGVRDAWGGLLHEMWERMHRERNVIGGAIWSGIDDVFYLPDGTTVGYGAWGPIDAFRRPKPEYWHVKKTYSPIRARLTDDGRLAVENRHDFTDLSELTIRWRQGERSGALELALPPRAEGEFDLPAEVDRRRGPVELRFRSPRGFEIDRFLLGAKPEEPAALAPGPPSEVRHRRDGAALVVSCRDVSFRVDAETGAFGGLFLGGRAVLAPGLHFMMIPLNGEGDTQMTPGMAAPRPFNPICGGWSLAGVEIAERPDGAVRVEIAGRYAELDGAWGLALDPWGRFSIEYDMTVRAEVNPRQWGLSLEVPRRQDRLAWSRDAEWTTYPDDHIGRAEGSAAPAGILSPRGQWPEHPWSLDHSELGCNDFRATRRRVRRVSLTGDDGAGVEMTSDGRHASRCWVDGDRVRWLIAAFDHPGAERFLRGHVAALDRPLRPGDRISDTVTIHPRRAPVTPP